MGFFEQLDATYAPVPPAPQPAHNVKRSRSRVVKSEVPFVSKGEESFFLTDSRVKLEDVKPEVAVKKEADLVMPLAEGSPMPEDDLLSIKSEDSVKSEDDDLSMDGDSDEEDSDDGSVKSENVELEGGAPVALPAYERSITFEATGDEEGPNDDEDVKPLHLASAERQFWPLIDAMKTLIRKQKDWLPSRTVERTLKRKVASNQPYRPYSDFQSYLQAAVADGIIRQKEFIRRRGSRGGLKIRLQLTMKIERFHELLDVISALLCRSGTPTVNKFAILDEFLARTGRADAHSLQGFANLDAYLQAARRNRLVLRADTKPDRVHMTAQGHQTLKELEAAHGSPIYCRSERRPHSTAPTPDFQMFLDTVNEASQGRQTYVRTEAVQALWTAKTTSPDGLLTLKKTRPKSFNRYKYMALNQDRIICAYGKLRLL